MSSWTNELVTFNESQRKTPEILRMNMRFELQMAQYVIEICKPFLQFLTEKKEGRNTLLIKKEKDVYLTNEQFMYWWQVTRYNELSKEMKKIQDKLISIMEKLQKLKSLIPQEEENEDEKKKEKRIKKTKEMNEKIQKLVSFLKSEEPQMKLKLKLLDNFRNTYLSRETLSKLLESIQIVIENEKN